MEEGVLPNVAISPLSRDCFPDRMLRDRCARSTCTSTYEVRCKCNGPKITSQSFHFIPPALPVGCEKKSPAHTRCAGLWMHFVHKAPVTSP